MRPRKLVIAKAVMAGMFSWLTLGALVSIQGMGVRSGFDAVGGGGAAVDFTAIASDTKPSADDTYDLGDSSFRWQDSWLSGHGYYATGSYVRHADAASGLYWISSTSMDLRISGSSGLKLEAAGMEANKSLQLRNKLRVLAGSATINGSGSVASSTQIVLTVAAQSGTTDDLDTITGGTSGQILWIKPDAGDTITVRDGVGNISCHADYTLNDGTMLGLYFDGTTWFAFGV